MRITKEELEKLKNEYPVGLRVVIKKMDDVQAPPTGTKGFVRGVDDIGNIMMRWDNGSGLSVIYNEDKIEKVKCKKCGKDIIGYPAMSRFNENDEVCSECGTRESLEVVGANESEINNVVNLIRKAKMDRDVLIEKIIKLTDYKMEDLEKKSDSELFDIYLYLEDMGLVVSFDD